MSQRVKRAARVGPEAARGSALDTHNDTDNVATEQASEQLAIVLSNTDAVSLHKTATKFARHPSWRSA